MIRETTSSPQYERVVTGPRQDWQWSCLKSIDRLLFQFSVALVALAVTTARTEAACAHRADDPLWLAYKARFVATTGRVVDTGNARISHSEGQGWGMLLAQAYDDRPTFLKMWKWTDASLGGEGTSLHPWRWVPESGTAVPDPNNASDGDILIAWALDRAGRRWGAPEMVEAARVIAVEIGRDLITSKGGRTVLLPGRIGFIDDRGVVVNLSYYVFPAFDSLARLAPGPNWRRLRQDGLDLIDDARFGRWGLPPDWLRLTPAGRIEPAAGWPARFGYDAIRIPLYLIWSGLGKPERLAAFRAFWRQYRNERKQPSWTDFSDNKVAPYPASAGFTAVAELVEAVLTAAPPANATAMISDANDYYSSSLVLLAGIAACEERHGTGAHPRTGP